MKVTYFADDYKNMTMVKQTSKVYGECSRHFPSGYRKMYKVWNNVRGCMVWVKKDACTVVEE